MTPEEKEVMDTLLDLINKGLVKTYVDEQGRTLFVALPVDLSYRHDN